jgi:polyhydroxyalkanoate synthesis regulator phasin
MDQTAPSPTEDALEQIGRLATAGASRARMAEAVGRIVAAWADEPDMNASAAQARIEEVWDSLGKDAADLEQQIGDTADPDPAALASARRTLSSLQAAVTVLAAAHARL